MGCIEFSPWAHLIPRGTGPWDCQAWLYTPPMGLLAWSQLGTLYPYGPCCQIGWRRREDTEALAQPSWEDSRGTCDVCPAWLWLEEGHTCHALSQWAMWHATAAREIPAGAHGPLGMWVQWDAWAASSAPRACTQLLAGHLDKSYLFWSWHQPAR